MFLKLYTFPLRHMLWSSQHKLLSQSSVTGAVSCYSYQKKNSIFKANLAFYFNIKSIPTKLLINEWETVKESSISLACNFLSDLPESVFKGPVLMSETARFFMLMTWVMC